VIRFPKLVLHQPLLSTNAKLVVAVFFAYTVQNWRHGSATERFASTALSPDGCPTRVGTIEALGTTAIHKKVILANQSGCSAWTLP
jgi:hypothetical protein